MHKEMNASQIDTLSRLRAAIWPPGQKQSRETHFPETRVFYGGGAPQGAHEPEGPNARPLRSRCVVGRKERSMPIARETEALMTLPAPQAAITSRSLR